MINFANDFKVSVDELHRFLLPIDLRRRAGINKDDKLYIYLKEDNDTKGIIISKSIPKDLENDYYERKLDELNRIILPQPICTALMIGQKTVLECYFDKENQRIILMVSQSHCMFTGATANLFEYMGRKISEQALKGMIEMYNKEYGEHFKILEEEK